MGPLWPTTDGRSLMVGHMVGRSQLWQKADLVGYLVRQCLDTKINALNSPFSLWLAQSHGRLQNNCWFVADRVTEWHWVGWWVKFVMGESSINSSIRFTYRNIKLRIFEFGKCLYFTFKICWTGSHASF